MREFSRSLPMALLRAREAVMREFRPSLRDHDMTEQQWRVLRALSAGDEMEVAELANATCLLGPSLSRILRDLDERRLVIRRASKADLRRSFVSISAEGTALIARVAPISEAIYAALAKRYGAAKLKLLYEMLGDLEHAVKANEERSRE
jgi:homoprotocatechuate degradation regulator HpaR